MSLRCTTCDLTLNSKGQYEQHMTGKAHAKKLKKLAMEGQDPTATRIKPINFVQSQGDQAGQPPSDTGLGGGESKEADMYCELCMIRLNSKEQARIHYGGTKHLKKLKMVEQYYKEGAPAVGSSSKNGTLFCRFCNITVNSSQQMDVHREGVKHQRMVEGMKRPAGVRDGVGPAAKRRAPADPTNNIPHVSRSQIVPLENMLSGPSAESGLPPSTGM